MGLDFLRRTALSHTKAWTAEFRRAADDLFAPSVGSPCRSFLASILCDGLQEGDEITVRLHQDCVYVLKDVCPLAKIDKPSLDLLENLDVAAGVLSGTIEETNEFARMVSVRIGEKAVP